MTRFGVDPAVLGAAAGQVRAATHELEGVTGEERWIAGLVSGLDDPVLVGAMGDFVARWRTGLSALVDDTRRIADALAVAAAVYADVEVLVDTALRGRSP
jgi:hypothetical protein